MNEILMTKKFLALAKADITERITIKDKLLDAYIDPVFEDGMKFNGEVMIVGIVNDDTDQGTLAAILQDYLREHVEFARVRQVDFQPEQKRERNMYRRTG